VAAVAVMLSACGAAAPTRTVTHTDASTPRPPCSIPADLPTGSGGSSSNRPLSGPAVASLRGGAAKSSFSLDAGGLVVNSPGPGDRPAVTRDQAECDALASLNANNFPFSGMAIQSGIAIGYGRVSVRRSLLTATAPVVYRNGEGQTTPTVPAPTPYVDRLAWVVVFEWTAPISCPDIPVRLPGHLAASTTPSAPPSAPASPDYQVFLLDATTGGGALVYTEGRPAPCGGRGTVPPEVNVPVKASSAP
jgi:hypothetical protein